MTEDESKLPIDVRVVVSRVTNTWVVKSLSEIDKLEEEDLDPVQRYLPSLT